MFLQMNKLATSLSTNCHAQYYYIARGFLRRFLREFPGSLSQVSLLLVVITRIILKNYEFEKGSRD